MFTINLTLFFIVRIISPMCIRLEKINQFSCYFENFSQYFDGPKFVRPFDSPDPTTSFFLGTTDGTNFFTIIFPSRKIFC